MESEKWLEGITHCAYCHNALDLPRRYSATNECVFATCSKCDKLFAQAEGVIVEIIPHCLPVFPLDAERTCFDCDYAREDTQGIIRCSSTSFGGTGYSKVPKGCGGWLFARGGGNG
jgi:hypothetical protein